jgi:hypothetical protein
MSTLVDPRGGRRGRTFRGMWSVRLSAACALSCAGCAAAAPAPSHHVAATPTTTPTTTVRFVAPPIVFYGTKYGSVQIHVRLNRPLHHTVGEPHDYADEPSSLSIPGTYQDGPPGLEVDALRPTCYDQLVFQSEGEPALKAGDPVPVTLDLGHGRRVTATATVQIPDDDHDANPTKALGCPRAPDTHVCHGEVYPEHFDEISVTLATGTSCATARAVMQSVARWVSDRCWEHLCLSKHRMNRGFRCDAALSGEAAWDIVCTHGKAVVRGFAAD